MKHSHPTIRQQKPTRKKTWPKKAIEEKVTMPRKPNPKPLKKREVAASVNLDVTAIVVNFNTKTLIKQAIQTFRKFYPSINLLIIDNASIDGSADWLLSQVSGVTLPIILDTNIGHGPALDLGARLMSTKYAFMFDSDIKFHHGGFLEAMHRDIGNHYAIGWLRWVNRNGVAARGRFNKSRFCPYVHPCFAMFDLEIYRKLKPFVNKGAPLVDNMHDARDKGYSVANFPFEKYADHLVAGTRRLYFGHWFPKDEPPKQQWNPDAKIPI